MIFQIPYFKKGLLFIIAFAAIHHVAFAQVTLSGTVVDADSYEPMAFVNVHLVGTKTGTTSNIDGKYALSIPLSNPEQIVEFSFVGYEKIAISIQDLQKLNPVKLKNSSTELQEVVVRAGENPAHDIIRKAIASKDLNDPKFIDAYTFNCYNKTIYTASGLDNDSLKVDSLVEKYLKYGHLLVFESYSEVKRMRPTLTKETVLKNKVSGLADPKFAVLSSSFQPFAFYEEQVNLFGIFFINPLSNGSLKRYEFYLKDKLLVNSDTTFVLSFEPERTNKDKTLAGLLYINTDGYAIENIIASPADTTLKIEFRIQQKYERVNGQWFPKELYTRYLMKDGGIAIKSDSSNSSRKVRYIPMVFKNQSYFTNIDLNPSLTKADFDLINIEYETDALHDIPWDSLRADVLSNREVQTYYNYDTLSDKTKRLLNKVTDLTFELAGGKVPFGKISLLPNYLLRFNLYEKVALGIGLTTNDRLSKVWQLQGYGMYGFGDKALKYGGAVKINVSRPKQHTIDIKYSQDIEEPGTVNFIKPNGIDLTSSGDVFRRFLRNRMDSVERIGVAYNFRPARFTELSIFGNRESRDPTYQYAFEDTGLDMHSKFVVSEVGLNIRFLFKETITKIGGYQIITGNSFPYITARVSKSIEGLLGGEYSFTKADIRIKQVINTIALGKTSLYLNVSKAWGDNIPYPYLNFGNAFKGDNKNNISVYAPGYFQTMRLYEFASDTYGQFTLEHNFGSLFSAFKGVTKPELVIVQNVAYGTLRNENAHEGVEIKTLEKGYFESGLMLNNLIRFDSKFYWFGYGAGVFYRYGPNGFTNEKDNFIFVLSSSISF